MRWRILGPVEVTVDGRIVDVRRPQQRAVLALLLLNADRVVPLDRVISALWAESPPASARTQVHVCLSRIRAALGAAGLTDVLATYAGGYRLEVAGSGLDLASFTESVDLAHAARAAGRAADAAQLLRDGLALWRGPALGGAAGAFVAAAAAGLAEQRLAAYEQLAADELGLGRHALVARTLRPLVAEHPLRERLIGRFMAALAASGQQAEALHLYARTRERLVEELGVEPATELAAIHLKVLRNEAAAPAAAPAPVPGHGVPAQLPTDVAGFTGRSAELDQLDGLLPAGRGGATGTAVVISAIGGTAGVGKTCLAVHFAHRVAHRFPDGQLYVNLRGFDQDSRRVAPGEALRGFLAALNVPPQRMPADVPALAALYRSRLAGLRMLVVLDNAYDCDQVRPLLPGSPGCMVVVTSRHRLAGLVAAEGARPLALDVMSAAEARELLARRIGWARTAREPGAVEEIIERCVRLPLALAVVAARTATTPGCSLADLAAELRRAHGGRLAALDAGDTSTNLRAVFSWSYQTLEPAAARLFRLLGLHPGPEVTEPAMASLAGVAPERAGAALAGLANAHLVTLRAPGRYTLHDLLRDYAAELCPAVDPEPERDAARHRMLDHYLHVGVAADRLLDPYRLAEPVTPVPARTGAVVASPADHAAAMDWFATEHSVLLAAVGQAFETGFDRHAWQLAAVLTTYLDRRGHWAELAAAHTTALAAARRSGDLPGQAQAHRGLAIARTWEGNHEEAHRHYREDLALYSTLGDRTGLANTHIGVGWVYARQGCHREALAATERALDLFRAAGSPVGQAKALNNLGWLHARVGDHAVALACCRQALALHDASGDRHGAALTWDSIGYVHHRCGRNGEAVGCYRTALRLHRALGDRYDEAEVLANLGDAWQAAGDGTAARQAWRDALAIFDELGHPDAERLRITLGAAS